MRTIPAIALAGLLTACAATPEAGPKVTKASVLRLDVQDQSFTEFTAVAHVEIPAGPAVAEEASWELQIEGEVRASGTSPLSAELPAEGGVVQVAARTTYAPQGKLAEVLDRAEPLPILLRGTVRTAGGHVWEFSKAGLVRTPRTPEIKVWHVEAGAFPDEKKIGLVFFVHMENRNPFEVQLEELTYDLAINGKQMIERGTAGRKERVPAASVAQLEIPLTLSERNFPDVVRYLRGARGLTYDIAGDVLLGVGRIPVELNGPIELGKSAPEEE